MNDNQARCWSLWQPFADGCVSGEKKIETRGRNVNVRGTVYIHATARKELPLDVFIGIHKANGGTVENFISTNLYWQCRDGISTVYGAIIGSVEIVDCVPIKQLYGTEYDTSLERAYGDWTPGRFGIILANPKPLSKPVPAKGHQGFWFFDKYKLM